MRIVAGALRGRRLVAPAGQGTRPTADRVRQALFDMLLHAPWGGRSAIEGACVLDVFAGTGALGLEALSRGAASVYFIESDPTALQALRANIAACRAVHQTRILACDVLTAPLSPPPPPANLVFLDPPYGLDLVPKALHRLLQDRHIRENALVVAETSRDETWLPNAPLLDDRRHGAARIIIFRAPHIEGREP